MTCGKFLAGLLAVSLSGFTYAQAPVYAQTSEGSLYVFHSSANATCPALDWHIVVLPNNMLEGIIAWDGMKAIAHAVGEIGPNRNFTMHANEVGGQGRTATVTGTV